MQATGIDPTQPDPGVVFTVAPHAFLLFAAILSLFLLRRDRRWQGAAIFIGGMALASWIGWGLVALLPTWTPARPAFVGAPRVIFHASQGARLVGPLLLYGFARWELDGSCASRGRWLVEDLSSRFIGVLAVCVLGYPSIMRGNPGANIDPLRLLYGAVDVVAVVESGRLAFRWLRARGWRDLLRWSAAPIWIVMMLILGAAILLVFGPHRLGFWGGAWRVEEAGLVPLWGLVCGVLGTALLRRPEP
jgi:hypothetical protein